MDSQDDYGFATQGFQEQGVQQGFQEQGVYQGFQEQGVQQGFQEQGVYQGFQEQGVQQGFQEQGVQQGFQQEQPYWGQINQEQYTESTMNPFGVMQETMEEKLPWWKKGARVMLLAGVGVFLLAVVVFIVATNIKNSKTKKALKYSTVVEQDINQPQEQVVQDQTQVVQDQTQVVQDQTQAVDQLQVTQEPVQEPRVMSEWILLHDTDGYVYVDTKVAEFTVKSKGVLYFRQEDGGIQIRNVARGTIAGYEGVYEVDIPRSAVMYDEIIKGFTFSVCFDVYTSSDGNSIFLENLRPNS